MLLMTVKTGKNRSRQELGSDAFVMGLVTYKMLAPNFSIMQFYRFPTSPGI
jgi:hypothetical protein